MLVLAFHVLTLTPVGTSTSSLVDGDPANPRVFFSGLPDPLGRYRALKMNESYSRYEMCVPPVFDAQGIRIPPAQYKTAIPNGTIVVVQGSMKMCACYLLLCPSAAHVDHARFNIRARGFVNRPYLFVFNRIQVVGEEAPSWGSDLKKRPRGSAEPEAPKRFRSDPGPSNSQLPYGEGV